MCGFFPYDMSKLDANLPMKKDSTQQPKTFNSIVWSSIERFSVQGIQFVLSFVIARKLLPSDYGLIAMLGIFMAIAQTFIDSGFSNALIQKQDRTNTDYSTVFYFNIVVAFLLYGIMVGCAPYIASFYQEPLLKSIILWVGLNFVINSFATVQRAKLTIELNFKVQAYISLTAVILSGSAAVYMAYNGFGVWTLVYQGLLSNLINTLLLWIFAHWKPLLIFSQSSFKELFSFGSKLLGGAILHTLYTNIYTLIIGKIFSSTDLGFYNRAFTLTQYPSTNITGIVVRVTYPIECQLQHDNEKLQDKYFSFIRYIAFMVFPLMIGLAAISEPLIKIVLTEKWMGAVPYIQIMCFAYMWDPIMRMTWDLLNVKHRSDFSLKSEIIKKITAFSILFITIPFGIKVMCVGLIGYSIADLIIISQFVKKILPQVNFMSIVRQLIPCFTLAFIMGVFTYLYISLISNSWLQLIGGICLGGIIYLVGAYFVKLRELTSLLKKIKK